MAINRGLNSLLAEAQASPESVGLDLRMDLAAIILREIDARRWSQKRLALAADMDEASISRIIHGDANCEFDTAGRILHALGLDAKLVVKPCEVPAIDATVTFEIQTLSDGDQLYAPHVENAIPKQGHLYVPDDSAASIGFTYTKSTAARSRRVFDPSRYADSAL